MYRENFFLGLNLNMCSHCSSRNCCSMYDKCRGPTGPRGCVGYAGDTGERGDVGKKGITGPPGHPGNTGYEGVQGAQGPMGPPGQAGATGQPGRDGYNGKDGKPGVTGPQGASGVPGVAGPQGPAGPAGASGQAGTPGQAGATGPTGPTTFGPTGPVGPSGGSGTVNNDVFFAWSSDEQPMRQQTETWKWWQYVTFNEPIIKPSVGSWTVSTTSGYDATTTFTCTKSGTYLLTYKLDVRAGNTYPVDTDPDWTGIPGQGDFSSAAACILKNGLAVPGSTTLIQAPEERHIFTIQNCVLTTVNANDIIHVALWASDNQTKIGDSTGTNNGSDPAPVIGNFPWGGKPLEAVASFLAVRVTNNV